MKPIAMEHKTVLKTMSDSGLMSRQAMKSVRGQLLKMRSCEEREVYLKKIIKNIGKAQYNSR